MSEQDDQFFNDAPKQQEIEQQINNDPEQEPENLQNSPTTKDESPTSGRTSIDSSTIETKKAINSTLNNLIKSDKTKRIPVDIDINDHVTIHICETEKRLDTTGFKQTEFITYLVEIRPKSNKEKICDEDALSDSQNSASNILNSTSVVSSVKPLIPYSSLWRRFSEFDQLRDFLIVTYPHVVMPVIPSKTFGMLQKNLKSTFLDSHKVAYTDKFDNPNLDSTSTHLLESRRAELEQFLKQCLSHHELKYSEILWSFLQDGNEFTWKLAATGYSNKTHKFNQLIDHTTDAAKIIASINTIPDQGKVVYNKCYEIESSLRDFINAYKSASLNDYSTIHILENYSRAFSWLSEIEISIRSELSMAAPLFELFKKIVRESQEIDQKQVLTKLCTIERMARKSLRNGQRLHYNQYQSEVKTSQLKLDEIKLERSCLASGSIPKNISSFRGIGSMLKAVTETNYEREARSKKLERSEQLGQQLVGRCLSDFELFKSKGNEEILKFDKTRQTVCKETLKCLIRNKIETLKKCRENWKEIHDIVSA